MYNTGVVVVRGEGDSIMDAWDSYGQVGYRGGSVSELPCRIFPPAKDGALTVQRAGMHGASTCGDVALVIACDKGDEERQEAQKRGEVGAATNCPLPEKPTVCARKR